MMERKIGEIFEYNGEWYQCVEEIGCDGCAFDTIQCSEMEDIIGQCTSGLRHDDKSVVFKKLEKVGEPYMDGGKIMQKYNRVYREPIYFPYKELNCYNDLHGRICIEIKQNKEDMEEVNNPNLSNTEKIGKNLREFDLEAAKSGKPVCTRDGRKARIICFDKDDKDNMPIVALVYKENESVYLYYKDGRQSHFNETKNDLMMLPEKKEGWIVIRRSDIYENEEQAKEALLDSYEPMMIRQITWEE